MNSIIPATLIRQSKVFVYEPSPGMKSNLVQLLSNLSSGAALNAPIEYNKLIFVVIWLYSLLQERLRYIPIGFTKFYEFNDADLLISLKVVKEWLNLYSNGRNNISPQAIPWEAIKSLIKDTVYGGKIDNEADQLVIDSFVDKLFTIDLFKRNFVLVHKQHEDDDLLLPETNEIQNFIEWTNTLPDLQSPHWLGLPNDSENVLMSIKGISL
jgi:dynein heavy chain 1